MDVIFFSLDHHTIIIIIIIIIIKIDSFPLYIQVECCWKFSNIEKKNILRQVTLVLSPSFGSSSSSSNNRYFNNKKNENDKKGLNKKKPENLIPTRYHRQQYYVLDITYIIVYL